MAAVLAFKVFGVMISTWITIASIAYQIIQSKKLREQGQNAAEVRKGFETVAEGNITTLPLVYGRALVGGARVYHKTNGSYKHHASNANKVFSVGPPGSAAYVHDGTNIPAVEGNLLDKDIAGSKNEFLFVQQAICQGPISRVVDVIINESLNLDDPSLGTWTDKDGQISSVKAALRIDCHNGDTPTYDAIMAANDGQRVSAKFPGAAYASMVFRLDIDNPQFQGVPTVQFVVEGRKIRKVVGGALESVRVYSNNPAWVLLDYLLDNTAGKGVPVTSLDLTTFEAAAAVCDTVVMPTAVCGGKVWNPTDKAFTTSTRELPLYECNMIIDVAKPIRSNVETILGTMGDARLVWSRGKYKLLLQYPATNEAAVIAAALTDDDLVMDDSISITWPSSGERLNYATMKYHDEAMEFKENSVSWPPKRSGTILRGIGNDVYPPVSGWDMAGSDPTIGGGTGGSEEGKQAHELLNSYGVWSGASGSSGSSTMTWKFAVKTSGVHTLKFAADNAATVTVLGNTLNSTIHNQLVTGSAAATKDEIVTISVTVTDSGGLKGFAGTIVDSAGFQVWTSRSPAYTDFITINQSSAVYDAMLAEDNGVNLESDTFGDGITDYYHALAKAEELVRTSRSAFVISFKYLIKDHFFEPGDIIRLDSETLNLGSLYIRVSEAKVQDGLVCQITGSRFDWTQLAWNVADDQYIKPRNPYDNRLPAPPWVEYSAEGYLYQGTSGSVNWGVVSDTRVVGYIVYAHSSGNVDDKGAPLFTEVGRSAKPPFELPPITLSSGIFGVKSFSSTGAMSSMTLSRNSSLLVGKTPPAITDLVAVSSATEAKITLTGTLPELRADGSKYDDHAATIIFRGPSTDIADALQIGETVTNTFVDLNEVYLPVYYWAKLASLKGVVGPESNRADSEFNHFGGIPTDSTPPPAPYNLVVEGGYTTMTLRWQNPTVDQFGGTMIRDGAPTYKLGGGHGYSKVYGARKIGSATPIFEDASVIGTPIANMFVFARPLGETWYFWVKEVSKGGGVSLTAAGPQFASTAVDVVKTLAALNGAISQSELTTALSSKIDASASGVTNLTEVTTEHTTSINNVVSVASNAAATANSANNTATAAYSAISTTANAVAGLSAQYTVKVDVNGYVAGFGLAVTDSGTPSSEFQIRADRFSVGQPGYGNVNPLIVQTSYAEIGGQPVYPGVYINDAYIRNGTIVSAKIGVAAVDTLRIAGYAVTVPMFAEGGSNYCETSYQYLEAGTLLAGTATYSAGNDANFTGYYAQVDIVDSGGNVVGSKSHGFSFTSWGSAAFGAGITIPYTGYFKVRMQTYSAGAGYGWGTGCSIYATAAKR